MCRGPWSRLRPACRCRRAALSRGGTASMPDREKGPRSTGSRPAVPYHVPLTRKQPRDPADLRVQRRSSLAEIDWLAEERGFELSVPLARISLDFRGGEGPSGRSEWSKQAIRFSRGTSGSNPLCSAGESDQVAARRRTRTKKDTGDRAKWLRRIDQQGPVTEEMSFFPPNHQTVRRAKARRSADHHRHRSKPDETRHRRAAAKPADRFPAP
jgi:hypothetical protein